MEISHKRDPVYCGKMEVDRKCLIHITQSNLLYIIIAVSIFTIKSAKIDTIRSIQSIYQIKVAFDLLSFVLY